MNIQETLSNADKTLAAMKADEPQEKLEDVVRELLSDHRDRLENISSPMFSRLSMALGSSELMDYLGERRKALGVLIADAKVRGATVAQGKHEAALREVNIAVFTFGGKDGL